MTKRVTLHVPSALACALGVDAIRVEPFTLDRQPAIRPTKIRFVNNPTGQTVLFSGMDLLPGQQDLFATDGQPAEDLEPAERSAAQ